MQKAVFHRVKDGLLENGRFCYFPPYVIPRLYIMKL